MQIPGSPLSFLHYFIPVNIIPLITTVNSGEQSNVPISNSSTLQPDVVNGLTQITDSHAICTVLTIILLHLVSYLSLSVGPIGNLEEHRSPFLDTTAEVNHSFSLSHVSSRMVADALCNIDTPYAILMRENQQMMTNQNHLL